MTYQADLSFNDWAFHLADLGGKLVDLVLDGDILSQKFLSATYGKSNAEIAATWNRTEDDVVKLQYALQALHDLYLVLNNSAVAARDRRGT